MAKILIVDDQNQPRADLVWAAKGPDRQIVEAMTMEEAIDKIAKESFDLVITDLELVRGERDTSGLKVLQAAKERDVYTQVIVCTYYGSPATSVEAMRLGAFDYMERNPVGIDHLSVLSMKITQALEFRAAKLPEKTH